MMTFDEPVAAPAPEPMAAEAEQESAQLAADMAAAEAAAGQEARRARARAGARAGAGRRRQEARPPLSEHATNTRARPTRMTPHTTPLERRESTGNARAHTL